MGDRMQESNIRRLAQMQFHVADKDRSGTLSLEEFLVIYAFVREQARGAKVNAVDKYKDSLPPASPIVAHAHEPLPLPAPAPALAPAPAPAPAFAPTIGTRSVTPPPAAAAGVAASPLLSTPLAEPNAEAFFTSLLASTSTPASPAPPTHNFDDLFSLAPATPTLLKNFDVSLV